MKPRKQCKHCPWKVSTDPSKIPHGYSVALHASLKSTIAEPGDMRGVADVLCGSGVRMMACHETPVGREQPCIGWLSNQLGPGNNIALRVRVSFGEFGDFETVGKQHERFEDTMLHEEAE